MKQTEVNVDIAIMGGGIAGLWLLNRLCKQGYNAILFEQGDLGGQQTIASQGMIHGGIKYALSGALTGSSEAIADMPDHWRRCLNGQGDVDLRQAKTLSDHFYLWSTASITSKFTSFFASKMARGRVENVKRGDYPQAFNNKQFKGSVYRLVDLVLDVPSVVAALSNNCAGRIFKLDSTQTQWLQDDNGQVSSLHIQHADSLLAVHAQRFVFAAGKGNGELMTTLGIEKPTMQLRPLQQVLVKHTHSLPLYAHCMGSNPSPRLTVSSHDTDDGQQVWYLGGDLATEGVNLSSKTLIKRAKQELTELLPWLDFSDAQWATISIDRAEPQQKGLLKPDKAFAETASQANNVIISWPTKLTLAPNMADEVQALLDKDDVKPHANHNDVQALDVLGTPKIGEPWWEVLFTD